MAPSDVRLEACLDPNSPSGITTMSGFRHWRRARTSSRGRHRSRSRTLAGNASHASTASKCGRVLISSRCSRSCRGKPTFRLAAIVRTSPPAIDRCFASFCKRQGRTWRSSWLRPIPEPHAENWNWKPGNDQRFSYVHGSADYGRALNTDEVGISTFRLLCRSAISP